VSFDERQQFIPVGQPLVFDELLEQDIAPDRTQPKGDRVEDQPEDDVFGGYGAPALPLRI